MQQVRETPSFAKIYGKRIVVIGGGAQVGLVATGAISEADRHNIRGERISVDTIPLVGEQELAAAVRAVVRLPRVKMLVLAGSLMGGDITDAVREVQAAGLRVISLNMAGSVPDVADLVVTDAVQAGRDGRDGGGRHGAIRPAPPTEAQVLALSPFPDVGVGCRGPMSSGPDFASV